jgi:hypothetical protein
MLDALREVAGWVKKNFWAKTDNIILRAGQYVRVGNSQLKDDKLGIGTTATPTRLMVYGNDAEATHPGSAVNAAIRIAKGGLTAFGERAEVQFAMGGASYSPGAAVSAVYTHWASGANPMGTDLRFATAPTNGTLTDRMSITLNGDVGIGTTAPASKLDVNGDAIIRGTMYSTGPLGWKHSKANVAHNTPTAIAKYTLSSNTASAVLVSIVASGTGILATKLFSVTTAWSTEVVTDLGGALFGFSGLVLTAAMNTATRECTLTLTQTNSSALPANIYISIQPLATHGTATMTFTGL